jgi:hypothetical protein
MDLTPTQLNLDGLKFSIFSIFSAVLVPKSAGAVDF